MKKLIVSGLIMICFGATKKNDNGNENLADCKPSSQIQPGIVSNAIIFSNNFTTEENKKHTSSFQTGEFFSGYIK